MFPIYSNMSAIGVCTALACALGFGLFGWAGAAIGVVSALIFFLVIGIRRARKLEHEVFQEKVERMQDQAQFTKRTRN